MVPWGAVCRGDRYERRWQIGCWAGAAVETLARTWVLSAGKRSH